MGSSSYLSTLDTVILFLRVWVRTVTRKNGNNSDNFFNSSLQSLRRHFPKPMLSHTQAIFPWKVHTGNIRSHF
jgi:hypothetical protein